MEYDIPGKVTVRGDGSFKNVAIHSQELKAEFYRSTTPKLSTDAFITAKIKNVTDAVFLAGDVNLFFGRQFIGRSRIKNILPDEEMELFLGRDKQIKVKRTKTSDRIDREFIGGIKRKTIIRTVAYKITLNNYRREAVKLNVFDHIPVPKDDRITVKLLNIRPKPTEENYEDKEGVMRWGLNLKQGEEKEIIYEFRIEYPAGLNINLNI
jgi:uncharacterized protein (TIGR02231 family)